MSKVLLDKLPSLWQRESLASDTNVRWYRYVIQICREVEADIIFIDCLSRFGFRT